MSRFDLAIIVGRFQPFHHGHRHMIHNALKHADKVLILIGSANLGRDTKNPFTGGERKLVLAAAIDEDDQIPDKRCWVDMIDDHPYNNNRWIIQVQNKISGFIERAGMKSDSSIAIVVHERDESIQYRKFFPQWEHLRTETDIAAVNATNFRRHYFEGTWNDNPDVALLPDASRRFLSRFVSTPEFQDVRAEWEFEKSYGKQWGPGPFLTADNVVIKSGHILVVERKKIPGKGRLAMPGGHLNVDETWDNGAVRELIEETQLFTASMNPELTDENKLEIAKRDLWPHYVARQVFDKVNRSNRARVITQAFLFKLPDLMDFPKVIGSDDAARAFWMPLSEVKPADFFEDHAFIIDKMLGHL